MIPPNPNIFFADLLIDFLTKTGVKNFNISPGSRSAPLVVAATEHSGTDVRVIIDERASGYHATGLVRATGQPAAVICTSGTAAANFYPSVIEAYYSRLPVIFITADRPEELQNRGANQTIDQIGVFGKYARSLSFEAPDETINPEARLKSLNEAARNLDMPLHINCRFREPLAPIETEYDAKPLLNQAVNWYQTNQIDSLTSSPEIAEVDLQNVVRKLNRSGRGIIIAGPESPSKFSSDLMRLSERLGWPLLADILSQHRSFRSDNLCTLYDLYLDCEEVVGRLRPEVAIHFGGVPVSKRLNQFLVDCSGVEYVKIQNHDRIIDPDRLETLRIICESSKFVTTLMPLIDKRSDHDYLNIWQSYEKKCAAYLEEHFSDKQLTEPGAIWHLARMIGEGEALFLSNSMPIRDADSFMNSCRSNLMVTCNRGVSGVDGIIASACGLAEGSGRRMTLVLGDLAFLHDLNSLTIAARSKIPINIVVVNNDGGGIFHFLPIAGYNRGFERYFATPADLNAEEAAQMFGLNYYHPTTVDDFMNDLKKSLQYSRPSVMEITTDRHQNLKDHQIIRDSVHQLLNS